jgi:signal transduction histidine kinase
MCVPMSKLNLVLLWTMVALQSTSLLGQVPSGANLHVGHDFWSFKEGAPEGVNALAQTSDGFLWLGSPLGLYRFDGARFELFHSPFGDQLLSTNIYTLLAPASGGLWIGYTFGGFSFLKNGRVTNYGGETASASGTVRGFAQSPEGTVWAGTTSGLWKFDHSHWQHVGLESNAPSVNIFEAGFDRAGTLWVLTGDGSSSARSQLICLRTGSRQFHMVGKLSFLFHSFALDADRYVVTSPESKPPFDDGTGNAADRPAAYPVLRKASSEILDRTRSVWIFPPEPFVLRLPPSERLSDAINEASPSSSETYDLKPWDFHAKLVDREGNIWFGDPKGLHRFIYGSLTEQVLPESAKGAQYFTVTPDDVGSVWITAGNYGEGGRPSNIYLVGQGQVKPRKSPSPLDGFAYRAPDRTIWFAGEGGLWHLVKSILIRVDLPREKADQAQFLQTITQDRRGGMWVSFGRHGLYRLANGVWTPYGGRDDLPKTGVVIEFTDSLGRVWFGYTKSQLAVLDGEHVQVFGPNDGIRVGNITAIYGRGSEIWIGGEFGLQQFDHGHFHSIQTTDNELLRGISGIVETATGDLWLYGLGGIFHLRRPEISEALKNSDYRVKGEHFGMREGLPGFAFQLRPLNTAVEGTDGRLWFATSGGVVWLDPSNAAKNVPPPPITIQSVSADDKSYQLGSELKFPAHTSNVQISYAAVSLSDPTTIRFRYRLQETDKDWHAVSAAQPVSYRNLAPRSYHFSVNATDTNGVWSDAVATTEFTILPAFYQTGWFIALCVVSALAFLYMLYMLRVRQLARQFEVRMEERVGERTRIARELHDTLLQSFQAVLMNLHVGVDMIRNRPDEAERILEKAAGQARQAVTEGRDAVEGLRCSTVVTNDLARAIRTLGTELAGEGNANAPDFRVDVEGAPRDLAPIVRDDVYRFVGEAIRNAFVHAQAKRIEVDIRYEHRQLWLRVRDDGKSIDPEVLESGARAGHYGLPGLHERAKVLGGKLTLRSDPGHGTEIELVIPASVAYASARGRRASFRTKSVS